KRAGVDDGDVLAVGHGVDAGKLALRPDIAADHGAAIVYGDGAVLAVGVGIDAVIGRVDRAGGQNADRAPIASEVLPGARIDAVLAGDDVPVVPNGDRTVVALRIGAGRAGDAVDPGVQIAVVDDKNGAVVAGGLRIERLFAGNGIGEVVEGDGAV